MNKEEKRETTIARLISNTRTRKRPNSISDIARDIRWLEKDLGSIEAVARIADISNEMLRRFLSVELLCHEIRMLVQKRIIDSVEIANHIRKFPSKAQAIIAKEVITGRLSAEDVKVLTSLSRSRSDLTIRQLISRVKGARDIKVYIAYFRFPHEVKEPKGIRKRFERIVGKSNIVNLCLEESIGNIELTLTGKQKLRKAAMERGISLRKLVDALVTG